MLKLLWAKVASIQSVFHTWAIHQCCHSQRETDVVFKTSADQMSYTEPSVRTESLCKGQVNLDEYQVDDCVKHQLLPITMKLHPINNGFLCVCVLSNFTRTQLQHEVNGKVNSQTRLEDQENFELLFKLIRPWSICVSFVCRFLETLRVENLDNY